MRRTRRFAWRYAAYGCTIVSDVLLPAPGAGSRAPCLSPEIVVRRGTGGWNECGRDVEWHADEDPGSEPVEGTRDRKAVLAYERAVFHLDFTGNVVDYWVRPGCRPNDLAHLVLDAVVPILLTGSSAVVYHAGVVARPGCRAAVVLGASTWGKSTLVASLGRAGWTAASDDVARVVERRDRLVVMPGPGTIRLRPEAAARLGVRAGAERVSSWSDKHRAPTASQVGELHLGAIVVLNDPVAEPAAEVELVRMEGTAALIAVYQHRFNLRVTHPSPETAVLDGVLASVQSGAFALRYPRRFDVFDEVAAALDVALA